MSRYFPGFEEKLFDVGEAQIFAEYGGCGKDAVLLLHGYPQTHIIWRHVEPLLAKKYFVVVPDLRGYGQSSCPPMTEDHCNYSKKAMAGDMIRLMKQLGYERFYIIGHDRGARVTHQLMIDYPDAAIKGMILDVAPTSYLYDTADADFGKNYWHWFFLPQKHPYPENIIENDVHSFFSLFFGAFNGNTDAMPKDVQEEYFKAYSRREYIIASTEDYRAGATIDCDHQHKDIAEGRRIKAPLHLLWGAKGAMGRYDMLDIWGNGYADIVSGHRIENAGHWLPEEVPELIAREALDFFA